MVNIRHAVNRLSLVACVVAILYRSAASYAEHGLAAAAVALVICVALWVVVNLVLRWLFGRRT